MENARCVLDLASLALKLKELGFSHIKVAAVEFPKFKTDSKDLIMKFFDPAGQEFENIEMIMQVFEYHT